MSFLSHLPLQKPPYWHHEVRMVGRGKPLKEARFERRFYDDLGAESDRNEAWRPMSELSPWPFCGWIPESSKASWASFHLQRMQSVQIFASRTGWLDTSKMYMKLQPGSPMRPVWINYPEYLSIVNEGL